MAASITVVEPDDVEGVEPVAGVRVRPVLSAGNATMTATRIAAGATTGWHHHGDVEQYGYVRSGRGRVEYGTAGEGVARLDAGDFYHLPTGCVHRLVTPDETPLDLLTVGVFTADATTSSDDGRDGDDGELPWIPVDGPEPTDPGPRVVGPERLVSAVETPNLTRETPFPNAEGVRLMQVRAAGGADAGWHHHGENRYFGYVVDGRSETEYGPDGERVAEVDGGECFTVPQGLVHRDTNPTAEEHEGIIWLVGGEPWVVNVDSPRASGTEG